jgi:glycosyl transferase family 25
MKIFITAIPRLSNRFAYVRAHVASISDLPYEIVGVDGTEIDRTDAASGARHNPDYPSPQIGCSLSHVTACRRIVEQGLPYALVVEDDIVLPAYIDALVARIGAVIRPGEVISLYSPTMVRTEFAKDQPIDPEHGLNLLLPLDMKDVRTGAAYVIEREAAAGIAAGNDPVRFLADDFRSFYDSGFINHVRIIHPTPCSVKPFQSSLEHFRARSWKRKISDVANRLPLVSSLVALRRWLLRQKHSRNIVPVDRPSPVVSDNPSFLQRGKA